MAMASELHVMMMKLRVLMKVMKVQVLMMKVRVLMNQTPFLRLACLLQVCACWGRQFLFVVIDLSRPNSKGVSARRNIHDVAIGNLFSKAY